MMKLPCIRSIKHKQLFSSKEIKKKTSFAGHLQSIFSAYTNQSHKVCKLKLVAVKKHSAIKHANLFLHSIKSEIKM